MPGKIFKQIAMDNYKDDIAKTLFCGKSIKALKNIIKTAIIVSFFFA